mmetsp:Transcript_36231/g.84998  ORF Transcript_36231/g.84998 Transcript_36231/m.84998 type:complete len:205 (-) Transcript_36231:823-1437(-)
MSSELPGKRCDWQQGGTCQRRQHHLASQWVCLTLRTQVHAAVAPFPQLRQLAGSCGGPLWIAKAHHAGRLRRTAGHGLTPAVSRPSPPGKVLPAAPAELRSERPPQQKARAQLAVPVLARRLWRARGPSGSRRGGRRRRGPAASLGRPGVEGPPPSPARRRAAARRLRSCGCHTSAPAPPAKQQVLLLPRLDPIVSAAVRLGQE